MNLRDLADAFSIWMDCVAATLSGGISSVRGSRRVRLTEEETDTFKVDLPQDDKNVAIAADRIRIVNGAIIGMLPNELAAALQGSRTELVLQSRHFLFRPLDLPKRASEFLNGIVRSQIDRLTPWSAADAAFGWTPPIEADKDRIAVTVVATAHALVAPYVQALTTLGVTSIAVSTLLPASEGDGVPIEILQQKGAGALNAGNVRRVLMAVLLVAAVSMGLAMAADQVIGSDLNAQKSDVLHRLSERRAAIRHDGSGGALSAQLSLESRKREIPSSVIVLEALSQILPDHTYTTELRIEGDKLQVVGITHDAPSLIRLIEQSPHFTRATFFAPTTRSPTDPGERFHIEARIKPGFAVQR
jgi:general secretion pathway protein L